MKHDKRPELATLNVETTNKTSIFHTMELNELLAALEIIIQAEMISQDEFYEDSDKNPLYLH